MIVGHKNRIIVNNTQRSYFEKACRVSKNAYNYTINVAKYWYSKGIKWNKSTVLNILKKLTQDKKKYDNFKEYKEVSCNVAKQAIKDCGKAFVKFLNKKAKYPRYKGVKAKKSFYVDSYHCKIIDEYHIVIECLQKHPLRLAEPIRVDNPKEMVNIRVSFDGLFWWLSYGYEVPDKEPIELNGQIIAGDVGIMNYVTLSDGTFINFNFDKLIKITGKIKYYQRKISAHNLRAKKSGKKPLRSKRYVECLRRFNKWTKKRLAILDDFIHKTVMVIIRKGYSHIVMEKLNIKKMLKTRKYAKKIHIVAWGRFLNHLKHKCSEYNIGFHQIDPAYTSQTCSNCFSRKSIDTSVRTYECSVCGYTEDRDLNATYVIKKRFLSEFEGTESFSPRTHLGLSTLMVNGDSSIKSKEVNQLKCESCVESNTLNKSV